MKATRLYLLAAVLAVPLLVLAADAVKDDPLVRMPGTQPANGVNLESPGRCLNCHAGYNPAVEPGFNWKGSMMAQAARDFLYWSCLTVAAQDSMWAAGRPNATDICLRCHFPKGWLEGRSDPTNGSLMTQADYDGVQCDFCHRMYDPFFETTYTGTRESSDWLNYWDETNASSTPSQPAADATYLEDTTEALAIASFNGTPFYGADNLPFSADYTENDSGQYFVAANAAKRASFADAAARHQMLYSRHHKSKYMCGACHDVSNPILANLGFNGTLPNDGTTVLTTESDSAFSYFHVERTFSEFMLSAYSGPDGSPGKGPFTPDQFTTSHPQNHITKCQDCHMRDLVGQGCNKNGVPVRPTDSIEHPESGLPAHDLTGGNVWVSTVLASAIPGSPNYDSLNDGLLHQGPAAITLDLTQGEGIDPAAMLAGAERAREQLLLAASIENVTYDSATRALSFRVQNQTGHKLISGFPEGRRMFLNITAYSGGGVVYEVNPYDYTAGTLKGLDHSYSTDTLPAPQPLGTGEAYADELVYETHPTSNATVDDANGLGLTGEFETFHFALATGRYKDNRIPPKGFDITRADERLSVPVWHGTPDPNYYTTEEYAGGYDDVTLTIPSEVGTVDGVEVTLYYQTTSREYIEFLRNEINGTGNLTLSSPTPAGNPTAYIVQSDAFFSQLTAWGDTIWQLWTHNMNLDGAAPFMMAQAAWGTVGGGCMAPTPTLASATPANGEVALTWSDEHSSDAGVLGYRLYYDQAGKAQLVAGLGLTTMYADTGLTNGQEYCYKVTSVYTDCESAFSNILCATPTNQGQQTDPAGVSMLETGIYTGKGGNKTFTAQTTFNAGDSVTIRAYVVDGATGSPLSGATVELLISGPEGTTITTGPSDAAGIAEAAWNTKAPKGRTAGTTPGQYTVTTKNVTASGYHWDGVTTSTTLTIQ